ncbi:PASTA domain-containing protein [Granulicella arctica]|uniref:Beta-lactam-binding protein with PASTA domain n=1 Tax=Granulicella arctica TaxID=940613 RepID=A0A7Y9PHZ7_9BACT|nr:PASTA domain-containing protein [Granulicella arctica]NYF79506.1 beta-lactam-binding protein with PASTA domain [Granulicella arctica]
MKRIFHLVLGAMAMVAVVLLFAFTTMRLAIHGGEVEVPNLAGMTVSDATHALSSRGLNLVLISRFYSTTIPAGHIISQVPAPGVIVRHEWEIRAIESLGPQKVSIPNVRGMDERLAEVTIRRLSLDLGTVAHLPAPGDAEIVLAQTPPPNAGGVDSPRVSLLLSQKDDAHTTAFVMPSVVGLSRETAFSRIATLGLYAVVAPPPDAAATAPTNTASPAASTPPVAVPSSGPVTSQIPAAGHRVVKGEGVRLNFGG